MDDATIERARNEPRTVDPVYQQNDDTGATWLRGYADGFKGKSLDTPRSNVEAYLRGFIAGLQARRE